MDWVNDDTVIIHSKMRGSTFIKAFDDAPRWTKEELTIFKECFQICEISVAISN